MKDINIFAAFIMIYQILKHCVNNTEIIISEKKSKCYFQQKTSKLLQTGFVYLEIYLQNRKEKHVTWKTPNPKNHLIWLKKTIDKNLRARLTPHHSNF